MFFIVTFNVCDRNCELRLTKSFLSLHLVRFINLIVFLNDRGCELNGALDTLHLLLRLFGLHFLNVLVLYFCFFQLGEIGNFRNRIIFLLRNHEFKEEGNQQAYDYEC